LLLSFKKFCEPCTGKKNSSTDNEIKIVCLQFRLYFTLLVKKINKKSQIEKVLCISENGHVHGDFMTIVMKKAWL